MSTELSRLPEATMNHEGTSCDLDDESMASYVGSQESNELFPFLVLKNIFTHLKSSNKALTNCRLVCKHWNQSLNEIETGFPIMIDFDDNIQDFTKLITQEEAQLKCKTLTIRAVPSNPLTILFLEACGQQIEKLKLHHSIEFPFLLSLDQHCSNITTLDITPNVEITLAITTAFESGDNVFPRLTTLTIRAEWWNAFDQNRCDRRTNFTILLLRRAVKLRKLKLTNWSLCKWAELANESTVSGIIQRLTMHLQFIRFNFQSIQSDLWNPQLNIKILEITVIPEGLTSEMLSNVLQNVSGTLEEFTLQTDNATICVTFGQSLMHAYTISEFYLIFPCKMPQLKKLKINSCPLSIISSIPDNPQNYNMCKLLPNLNSLHQTLLIPKLPDNYFLVNCNLFWETIFPMSPNSNPEIEATEFLHTKLTDIRFDWIIRSGNIVEKIASNFPNMRTCSLNATKGQFQDILSILKDHKIQKLSLSYAQTGEEGITDFASAITGISLEQCAIANAQGDNHIGLEKIRPSLSDWKYLSDLTIGFQWNRLYQPIPNITLNNLCVQEGFAKLKNLKNLCLRCFKIQPKHITQILENISLDNLHLACCDIDVLDRSKENISNVLATVREAFPAVELRYNDLEFYGDPKNIYWLLPKD